MCPDASDPASRVEQFASILSNATPQEMEEFRERLIQSGMEFPNIPSATSSSNSSTPSNVALPNSGNLAQSPLGESNISRYLAGLPTFGNGEDENAMEFLEKLTEALQENNIPRRFWSTALLKQLPLELKSTLSALGLSQSSTWEEAREKFVLYYGKNSDFLTIANDLYALTPQSAGSFRKWALQGMHKLGQLNFDQLAIWIRVQRLPFRVQNFLSNFPLENMTIQEFTTLVVKNEVNLQREYNNALKAKAAENSIKNSNHSLDSKGKPPFSNRPAPNGLPDRKVNILKSGSGSCKQIRVLIEDEQFDALMDTGAQRSLISAELARRLKLVVESFDETIATFHPDVNVTLNQLARGVNVSHGGFKICTDFLIIDNPDFEVLLSLQDMKSLGYDFVQCFNKTSFQDCEDDFETFPEEQLINDEIDCYSSYYSQIEPFLKQNESIPKDSFCELPSAIIRLDTGNHKPSYRAQHPPIPDALSPFVEKKIKEWMDTGRIEYCNFSPYHSPLLVAEKKLADGTLALERLCLNPKQLNSQLEDAYYPIPLIKNLIPRVKGSQVFSTIDLKESFLQFQLHPNDRKKTAFSFNGRMYQFVGAPFGIKTLSFHVQSVMTELMSACSEFAIVYIDDIIIYSRNEQEHVQHVNKVLQTLSDAKLRIKPEKCKFMRRSILALGHIIDGNGLRPNPMKVQEVVQWEIPRNIKQLQSFLGLLNYFRNFIPNFATLARPLDKIRNDRTFDFSCLNEEHYSAIRKLKEALVSKMVLSFPDDQHPFHIATDASNTGIGAMLFQDIGEKRKFIGFASRALREHENNYCVAKKEILAVIFGLKYFYQYLRGRKFILYTDNKALTYLFEESNQSLVLNGWMDTLFLLK